jgi:NAD(P)H-dependent FMN reductase
MLKLLGVSGSLREKSTSCRALSLLLDTAKQYGAESRVLDLRVADLPMYNPDAKPDARVTKCLADVAWADAYVLASPDYHGSMSGAMKNFLDYHWSEFAGKLFAYLSASHERGITVMEGMRLAVRQCYGWSLPYNVAIHSGEDLDESGAIKNPKTLSRLQMTARDLVIYGTLLRTQFLTDQTAKVPDTFASRYT